MIFTSAYTRGVLTHAEGDATIDALLDLAEAGIKQLTQIQRDVRARQVINATGVILHTNLGRAPLPERAARAVARAARQQPGRLDREARGRRRVRDGDRHADVAQPTAAGGQRVQPALRVERGVLRRGDAQHLSRATS